MKKFNILSFQIIGKVLTWKFQSKLGKLRQLPKKRGILLLKDKRG